MKRPVFFALLYATSALAQSTTSLFVPVEYPINTFSASVAGSLGSETVYVFDCATASSCGPVTLVQGPGTARFTEADQPITSMWDCSLGGTTTASCLVSSASANSVFPGTSTNFYPSASGDAFPLYQVDITAGSTAAAATTTSSTCTPTSAANGLCPTAFNPCCAFICAEAQVPFQVCQPTDGSGEFAVCTACPGGSTVLTVTSTSSSSTSTNLNSTTTLPLTTTTESNPPPPTTSQLTTTTASTSSTISSSQLTSTLASPTTTSPSTSASGNINDSTTSFDLYTTSPTGQTAQTPSSIETPSVVVVTASPSNPAGPSTSVVIVTAGGGTDTATAASSSSPIAAATSQGGAGVLEVGTSLVLSWLLWLL